MNASREHAHELIDRLPEAQVTTLVQFLETIVDSDIPYEDEEITAELAAELDEARASLDRGEGVPHEEVLRHFGLHD
jgi:hypothetical protein